ncbi:hypothetical protein CK203_015350 [Vitis vinifera]|uniref:DUF4283 domain-containing protein n=1 Tax=Vitis vinifera TaxID=29760 RepID=A0A438JK56_VITVI|nr:hypothetical protein CK203_015350 [Vitis vinifera]
MEPKVGMLNGGRESKRGMGKDSGSSHLSMESGHLEQGRRGMRGFLAWMLKQRGWRSFSGKNPGQALKEAKGGSRPEVQMQSADGTRRLTSGSGRPMECSRGPYGLQLKPQGTESVQSGQTDRGLEAHGGGGLVAEKEPSDHLAEAQSCGPSHAGSPLSDMSLVWEKDGMRWLGEAELPPLERSKTDLALVKEASSGEYCDLSGLGEKRDEDENPLQMLMGMEPPVSELVECWDLVEASKDRMMLLEKEGLEKDIMEFLVKIRKRRESVHSKTFLEKSKFERELKRLECSINYEKGKKQNGEVKVRGCQITNYKKSKGGPVLYSGDQISTLSEGLVRSLGSGRWSNWGFRRLVLCGRDSGVLGQKVFGGDGDGGVYGPFSKEDRDCLWEELGQSEACGKIPGA